MSVTEIKPLHAAVLRTLLYYDMWDYPLTARELYAFLPDRVQSLEEFLARLAREGTGNHVQVSDGHYFLTGKTPSIVTRRRQKERHALHLWKWARFMVHIIKRFPFVRAILISGDLSKNATGPKSDVDFFIITEPGRLWIARTLLIMFKKIFLLNRKKYFCLNSFAVSNHLSLDERSIFLAAEVAHLKPLFNSDVFFRYLEANTWIKEYFPNFAPAHLVLPLANNRQSVVQKLCELPFHWMQADRLDSFLMGKMRSVWAKRYPQYDGSTRERIFRCTKCESRAYAGNFEDQALAAYDKRLQEFGLHVNAGAPAVLPHERRDGIGTEVYFHTPYDY